MKNFSNFYFKENEEYEIYLDMDGTITDFVRSYEALTDKDFSAAEKEEPEVFWEPINKVGTEFWSEMPWMADGKVLWEFIKDYNPTILSSPGKNNTSPKGKKIWIKRELGEVPFIFEKDKQKYAKKNAILIDDTDEKIDNWREAGGIGILHTSALETIEQLKHIMSNDNSTDDNEMSSDIST